METFRIKFTDIDSSEIADITSESLIKGLMQIKAPKGTLKPIYFPAGSTKTIKRLIGYPSSSYPGIKDALDFNSEYGLYLSTRPSTASKYGTAVFSKFGFLNVYEGVSDPETKEANYELIVPFGSSYITVGATTVTLSAEVKDEVTAILVDGLKYELNEEKDAFIKDGVSFAYAPTTGIITITIGSGVDADGLILDAIVEDDDPYFAVSTKSPTTLPLEVKLIKFGFTTEAAEAATYTTSVKINDVHLSYSESEYPNIYNSSVVKGSLYKYITVDGITEENPDFIENFIDPMSSIIVKVFKSMTDVSEFVISTASNNLETECSLVGFRVEDTSYSTTWESVIDTEYDDTKIILDPEGTLDGTIAGTLRNYFKVSTILSGVTVYDATVLETPGVTVLKDSSSFKTTFTNKLSPVKGSAIYFNQVEYLEPYTKTLFWTNLIGKIGVRCGNIMERLKGGGAPMYLNRADGSGGQITEDFKRIRFTIKAEAQKYLDAIGINPLLFDKNYKLFIGGQKTSSTVFGKKSDWDYLGNSMSFDLFRDEVRNRVLIPVLGAKLTKSEIKKQNDTLNQILNSRIAGDDAIWTDGRVSIDTSVEVLQQNKFLAKVKVKTTPFAEETELVFENVDQSYNF